MFSAVSLFIFNDINVISTVHGSSLKLAVPAVFEISAGENMLSAHGEDVQLVLLYLGRGDRFENIIQPVAVGSKSVGNGKQ